MKAENFYTAIAFSISAVLLYFCYKIFSPFFSIIAWAMVLSIIFFPVYEIFAKLTKRPWAASLITLLIILIIIVGPVTYITNSLVHEITETYKAIKGQGPDVITKVQEHPAVAKLFKKINEYTKEKGLDLTQTITANLEALSRYIAGSVSSLFKNVIVLAASFVVVCLTTFFFLKDGERLSGYIMARLPLDDEQKKRIESRIKEMIIATIWGGLFVGAAQGILGWAAFHVLGLPTPVLWGSAMGVLALIPFVGAAIIWGPAGILLILGGSYAKGIGLLLFGALVISMIDNLAKPLFIGGRTQVPMLVVLFSVLGGIRFFGVIGFVLGPLIAVLCLSLLDIYTIMQSEEETET